MVDNITIIALILSMGVLWLWNWCLYQTIQRHERKLALLRHWINNNRYEEKRIEDRCDFCADKRICLSYDTGVIYPCSYFKEENHGEEK